MHTRLAWLVILGAALPYLRLAPASRAETLTVPPCGFSSGTTEKTYTGLVDLTVSGRVIITPGHPSRDAFYLLDPNDPSTALGADPEIFRFARTSESDCTCFVESQCHPNQAVSAVLAGPYPDFNPEHTYTVQLDLGDGPAEKLTFGIADCGCWDNSGELVVTIEADADGDGLLDANELPICLETSPGATVNPLGCSVQQICPCSQPWGRVRWRDHREYVRCIRLAAKEFQNLGLMSLKENRQAVKSARLSDCGK